MWALYWAGHEGNQVEQDLDSAPRKSVLHTATVKTFSFLKVKQVPILETILLDIYTSGMKT